ncbi:unnamed protein product, partial [Mesorhabditis spiculigera]
MAEPEIDKEPIEGMRQPDVLGMMRLEMVEQPFKEVLADAALPPPTDADRFYQFAITGDYQHFSTIHYAVIDVGTTTKIGKERMRDVLTQLISSPECRPRNCQIWLKDIAADEVCDILKGMVTTPYAEDVGRSLLRLEMRDVWGSVAELASSLQSFVKIRTTPVYATFQDPRDVRSQVKGKGTVRQYISEEALLTSARINYLMHFQLEVPGRPHVELQLTCNDRVRERKDHKAMRHRYITVEQVLGTRKTTFATELFETHPFDVDATEDEMSKAADAYPAIYTLQDLYECVTAMPDGTLAP